MKEDKDVLEVYKKRVYNKLLIEKRAKLADIEKKDKFAKLADEYNAKINKILEDEGRKNEIGEYDIVSTPHDYAVDEEIAKVEKDFKDKMDDRDRLLEEVTAILKITPYEDTEDVLKKYGILREDGKIYDYKDENNTTQTQNA